MESRSAVLGTNFEKPLEIRKNRTLKNKKKLVSITPVMKSRSGVFGFHSESRISVSMVIEAA